MSDLEQHKKRRLDDDNGDDHRNSTSPLKHRESTSDLVREKEAIARLLEPFSREQLLAILASAAAQYDNIYDEIKAVASTDVVHRKVFVRGLAWETTSEALKDAFSGFGDVEEGAVIYDKGTNKSKGFGFVTFVDMEGAQRAIEQQYVEIDGRRASCNLAALRSQVDDYHQHQPQPQPRTSAPPAASTAPQAYAIGAQLAPQPQVHYQPAPAAMAAPMADESERKLFVRGLSWNTTDEMFRAEFQRYGELIEAMIARDRATGKSKGFGFITYVHKASADLALQQPQKIIDGRTTTCNLASQGGSRMGSSGGASHTAGGAMGYAGAMAPVMPAQMQAYAMPMYAAMPGQYGVMPQQIPQQHVQYGAYPGMADPYAQQGYGAVAAAPQYYQTHVAPTQQAPAPAPAPQQRQ